MSELDSIRDQVYRLEQKLDNGIADVKCATLDLIKASEKKRQEDRKEDQSRLRTLEKSLHIRMDRTEDEIKSDIAAVHTALRSRQNKHDETMAVRMSRIENLLEFIAEKVLTEGSIPPHLKLVTPDAEK